jgi:hypothetical protein
VPGGPRLEFWWLRARDLGAWAVVLLALLPAVAAAAGVRLLNRYRHSETGVAAGV